MVEYFLECNYKDSIKKTQRSEDLKTSKKAHFDLKEARRLELYAKNLNTQIL